MSAQGDKKKGAQRAKKDRPTIVRGEDHRPYLRVRDVMCEFGVCYSTIGKWCDQGFLKFEYMQTGRTRQRVFRRKDLDAFWREARKSTSRLHVGRRKDKIAEAVQNALSKDKPTRGDARKLINTLADDDTE